MLTTGDGTGFAEVPGFAPESPFLSSYESDSAREGTLEQAVPTALDPAFASPFISEYHGETTVLDRQAATASELLAALYDQQFGASLAELAAEGAALHVEQVQELGEAATQPGTPERLLAEWLDPLRRRAESMFDKMATAAATTDLGSLTETDVERLFEGLEPETEGLPSPAFENVLGGMFRKAVNAVKGAASLARRGVAAASRVLPIGALLGRLKRLVRPLLDRVLRGAIDRLPAALRPAAGTLARRLLGRGELEAEAEVLATGATVRTEWEAGPNVDALQTEFDIAVTNLLLAADETEQELLIGEAATDVAVTETTDALSQLDAARDRFITEFGQLERGQDPTPALQNFIPAVMAVLPIARTVIGIIGRQRVVNFLAKFLAQLIKPHVGAQPAAALSRAIADAGLRLVSLETTGQERERSDLAGTALAATVEDTVQRVAGLGGGDLTDPVRLEAATMEAFNTAAAANFPPTLLRPDLPERETTDALGTWVFMPRAGRPFRYKKYTRVFDVTITPQLAKAVRSFGGAVLADQLRPRGVTLPAQARVHVYEAIPGTWLSRISSLEKNVPGLGGRTEESWSQIHPLTVEAAGMLLQQPGLGRDVAPRFVRSRNLIGVGQRFYYLEITGARRPVRLPTEVVYGCPPRSSAVNITIDLRAGRDEIRMHLFFNEAEAQEIAKEIRAGRLSAPLQLVKKALLAGIRSIFDGTSDHVRILREAPAEEAFLPGAAVLARVGPAIRDWLVGKLMDLALSAVSDWLKMRATEYVDAADKESACGVTATITMPNPPPLTVIRMVLDGKIPSLGDLASLARGGVPVPSLAIRAGFHNE